MATPPTRVTGFTPAVGWASNATPKTSPTFDVQAGDLIVLIGFAENTNMTLATPTWTGSGAWTLRQSVSVTNYSPAVLYSCDVTTSATGRTVSMTRSGEAGQWSFYVTVWRNHGGLGVTGKANLASGAPSLALATAANSAIVCGNSDWNALSPTGRTWRSVNGTAMMETSFGGTAGASYMCYTGYSPDTGAAGTTTMGMLTPNTQKYSIVGAEILGTSSGSPALVAAPTWTSTAAMLAPSVAGGTLPVPATVTPTAGTASVTALAPLVTGLQAATVAAPAMAAAALAPAPTVGAILPGAVTTFDDGTFGDWTSSTAGAGSMTVSASAAHDGAYGALSSNATLNVDKAALTKAVGPAQQVTISGWWRVTAEGPSGSNVPFARLFYGGQRLVDVYRQNISGGNNVWMRVVKAAGGSNYWYIAAPKRLELNTWTFVELTWNLNGTPTLKLDGATVIDGASKPADWFAAPQIDTAWLGSQDTGNPGTWNIDTVTVTTDASASPATVPAPPATAVAAMLPPSVQGLKAAVVAPSAMTAISAALAPTVTGNKAAVVQAPAATAGASALAPSVSGFRAALVNAAVAVANAAMPAPSIITGGQAVVQAPLMGATATAPPPSVIGFKMATVMAPTGTATAVMPAPTYSLYLEALVRPALGSASAEWAPPAVSVGVYITAPIIAATAALLAPSVTNGSHVSTTPDGELVAYLIPSNRVDARLIERVDRVVAYLIPRKTGP